MVRAAGGGLLDGWGGMVIGDHGGGGAGGDRARAPARAPAPAPAPAPARKALAAFADTL